MQIVLQSLDFDLWDIVENGYTKPITATSTWKAEDKGHISYDYENQSKSPRKEKKKNKAFSAAWSDDSDSDKEESTKEVSNLSLTYDDAPSNCCFMANIEDESPVRDCDIPGVQHLRLVDTSGECRDKSESRWRRIDAKRTQCDARVGGVLFGLAIHGLVSVEVALASIGGTGVFTVPGTEPSVSAAASSEVERGKGIAS
uniref:Uncharacterized protein n=1 Tax=Ananas comosus var. bracteatus TaxID=296719 RepID=A0A6V7NSJ5_ANACO|nr:unnamed protein product [Ananas comosus var. bracteatus]